MLGKNSRNLGKTFFARLCSTYIHMHWTYLKSGQTRYKSPIPTRSGGQRSRSSSTMVCYGILLKNVGQIPKIECRLSDDPYEEEFTTEATSTATTPRSWRTSTASRQRPSDTGRSPPTFSSSPPLFRSLWSYHAHAMLFILMSSV